MNELPSQPAFQNCLNTYFLSTDENGREVELLLTRVSDLLTTHNSQSFSILYQGPVGHLMPQRIYHLSHPQLGEFDIFMVPVARQADGFLYEAVFNQILV
jgi:hypothetical protein